nr:hypothetical protein [Kitasatospora sp. Root107]
MRERGTGQRDDGYRGRRQARTGGVQHERGGQVVDDPVDALGGPLRVERGVGAARQQDAQRRHRERLPGTGEDGNERAGPDAQLTQRHLYGARPFHQFVVADDASARPQRGSVRRPRGHRQHRVVRGGGGGDGGARTE